MTTNLAARLSPELSAKHYFRKGAPSRHYWFSIYKAKLHDLRDRTAGDFCFILHGDPDVEDDFFSIPYRVLESVLVESTISHGKHGGNRWIGDVRDGCLRVYPGHVPVSISPFRGLLPDQVRQGPTLLEPRPAPPEVWQTDEEGELEDVRRELRVRLRQSRFRARVIENFPGGCCLTGIRDEELIEAAHIVPWAEDTTLRLDPSNGLCFALHLHRLFDGGYFSLTDDLTVVASPKASQLSPAGSALVRDLVGVRATAPSSWLISTDALRRHRQRHGLEPGGGAGG